MAVREPVHRTHFVARATPAEVYAVVTDFAAYPRLFPEIKQARVLSTTGNVVRVEFRAEAVIAVRYVLDLTCDPAALDVKAPLPGFILRRVTDGLVAASLPNMFASIERDVRKRQTQAQAPQT